MDKVIIVGGGLGGLFLALLLERASVDYVILERATEAKMPLVGGGVISITSQIQPLLQQLGLLDTLRKLSKPISRVTLLEVDQQQAGSQPYVVGILDTTYSALRYDYYSLAISRPELYNTFVDHIPASKFLLGKQVQDISQDETMATCICTDGTRYTGSVLVGSDGAYSNVRLKLYQQLKQQGKLPAADHEPMRYRYKSLIGMTEPLDPERFPFVDEDHSSTRVVVSHGDKPFTFWCVPMTGRRLCWMLDEPLASTMDCPDVEDWSMMTEAVQEQNTKYRALQSPLAGISLGDLFELTPAGTMLSLPREEGLFSTWTHGRIALIGDACHKTFPYAGQPFVQAGLDAASLANALYGHSAWLPLSSSSSSLSKHRDLVARLKGYEAARQGEAEIAVRTSFHIHRLLNWQGKVGTIVRYVILNWIPQFLVQRWFGDRLNRDRARADFLPKFSS